jgi:hypothetical protein
VALVEIGVPGATIGPVSKDPLDGPGKITLSASTGAKIAVWRKGDLLCVQPVGALRAAEECLAVDLFEVIADLTGLDLEVGSQAAEAIELAEAAQRRLAMIDSALQPDDSGSEEPRRSHCRG